MEKQQRKKTLLFIGAMIVAVMFVTSYAAFGTNGSVPTTSTTIKQATYVVFGSVNAVIIGYGSSLNVALINKSLGNMLNSTLSNLEANSIITNYVPTPGGVVVYAPGNSPYVVQQAFFGSFPANSIAINGTELVKLPQSFTLFYYGTAIRVYPNATNFTVPSQLLKKIGANTTVRVQALTLPNGFVYKNNIQVS
jgi:hypothetical protein